MIIVNEAYTVDSQLFASYLYILYFLSTYSEDFLLRDHFLKFDCLQYHTALSYFELYIIRHTPENAYQSRQPRTDCIINN